MYRLCQRGEEGATDTHRGWAKLVPCSVCNGLDRRQEYLMNMCRLHGSELDASFSGYWADRHGQQARAAAVNVLAKSGWLTLAGPYGCGKSYLLQAIVNEARRSGRLGVYIAMSDLLDHLRAAFKPGSEVPFGGLFELVCSADVLCIDEVEKYNATAWAEEKVLQLIDRRYREWSRQVTVLATNDFPSCPGYLKSRMSDGRFALVQMTGTDVRPGLRR